MELILQSKKGVWEIKRGIVGVVKGLGRERILIPLIRDITRKREDISKIRAMVLISCPI